MEGSCRRYDRNAVEAAYDYDGVRSRAEPLEAEVSEADRRLLRQHARG